jgi:hypothetical protein
VPVVPPPGRSEQGFLADLKGVAERVGGEVLGQPVRWEVESTPAGTKKRPDVVIRLDTTGEAIASGEAKRPDQPDGVHPLVTSNAEDALAKAQQLGAAVCFTTNFFGVAVLDARPGPETLLQRVSGDLIEVVPERLATAPDWWLNLPDPQREAAVETGLRRLFERVQANLTSTAPSADLNEVALLVFARSTDLMVADLMPSLLADRDTAKLSSDIVMHAKQVQLDVTHDLDARYLVAQGVAELLTAALFYRNIRDHFSLSPLLAGTDPASSKLLYERVETSLATAKVKTGDYDTIFGLSVIARWVLQNGGHPVLMHWKQLFSFVELLDFGAVTAEVIGAIFERLISPERRRDMGQHYTQSRLARSMSKWAVDRDDMTYADVASGAGTFLVEVYALLRARGLSHMEALAQIYGNDLDAFAVHLAAVNLATRDIYKGHNYPAVRVGDAFDIRLGTELIHVSPDSGDDYVVEWPAPGLDRIVGNPPYDEKPPDEDKARLSLLAIGGHETVPSGMSGGNLAAWFVLLAAALLKPDGRFALVLPVGVLQNNNLAYWRTWLRTNYDLVIWHTEVDVWFSEARVSTCSVLAVPRAKGQGGYGSVHFVDVREPVLGELVDIEGTPSPTSGAVVRDLSGVAGEADLLVAGTIPDDLLAFERLGAVSKVRSLAGFAIKYGNKLGHAAYELRDLDPGVEKVTRRVRGYAMDLTLHRKYLTPFLSGPRDERTGEFDADRATRWVLNAPKALPGGGALETYVRHLRKLRVHEKPSVEARGSTWYSVQWKTTHIAVQLHPGIEHQVWWSDTAFVAKNNFHLVEVTDNVSLEDQELVAASLASAFGALAALYVSTEVGCEGVRYVTVDHIEDWPVLDPSRIKDSSLRGEVLAAFRKFRVREAQKLHRMSAATRDEWLALTEAVARAAGAPDPSGAAKSAVREAEATAARRARREALALAGRVRGGGRSSATLKKRVQTYASELPTAEALVAGLCGGTAEINLRPMRPIVQETFDFEGLILSAATPEEEALAAVLGEGFYCAPRLDDAELVTNATKFLVEVNDYFVGPSPVGDTHTTYETVAAEVRRIALDWLQDEVRRRLS